MTLNNLPGNRDVTRDAVPQPIGAMNTEQGLALIYDSADYSALHNPTQRPVNQLIPYRYLESRIAVETYSGSFNGFDWLLRGNANHMLGTAVGMLGYLIANYVLRDCKGRIYFDENDTALDVVYCAETRDGPQRIERFLKESAYTAKGFSLRTSSDAQTATVIVSLPKEPITKLAEQIQNREREIVALNKKLNELQSQLGDQDIPQALLRQVIPFLQDALSGITLDSYIRPATICALQSLETAPKCLASTVVAIAFSNAIATDPLIASLVNNLQCGVSHDYLENRVKFDRKLKLALVRTVGKHRLGEYSDDLLTLADELLLPHWEQDRWKCNSETYGYEMYTEEHIKEIASALGSIAQTDSRTMSKLEQLIDPAVSASWWRKRLAILAIGYSTELPGQVRQHLEATAAFAEVARSSLLPLHFDAAFDAERVKAPLVLAAKMSLARMDGTFPNDDRHEVLRLTKPGYSQKYEIQATVLARLNTHGQAWHSIISSLSEFIADMSQDQSAMVSMERSQLELDKDLLTAIRTVYERAAGYPCSATAAESTTVGKLFGSVPLRLARQVLAIVRHVSGYGDYQSCKRAATIGTFAGRLFPENADAIERIFRT